MASDAIKRYDLETYHFYGSELNEMHEHDYGDWVRYDDHERVVRERVLDELRELLVRYCDVSEEAHNVDGESFCFAKDIHDRIAELEKETQV